MRLYQNIFAQQSLIRSAFSNIKSVRNFSRASNGQLSESPRNDTKTHFGFQTVDENEKSGKVHKVFEEVAKNYDFMNDAMSMGIHRLWKDVFVERLCPTHGTKLLDMAGGTGDIAFRCIQHLQNDLPKHKDSVRSSEITICDINQNMLEVGKGRAEKLDYTVNKMKNLKLNWVCGDAENLPFEENSFSVYTIAFGIRNCTHIEKVLTEAHRVLQRGGRFMCLEFSHLTNDKLQWLYDQYSFQLIPPMGLILTGQWDNYQYLVESIKKFPKQDEFKQMIQEAGFEVVQYENLTFGIVSIHSGFKL